MLCLVVQSCPTPCDPMDCDLPGSSVHGDSPDKNTGVGCHALLQGIFPTQGSNPGLPHCRQILYHLSHQGSPRTLEWVAYPFSRDLASITSHIHYWVLFLLWLHPFILSAVISPLMSSSILGTYRTGEVFHLSVSYLSAFSYPPWGSQRVNTEVVCHSLLQWTTFCQTCPP